MAKSFVIEDSTLIRGRVYKEIKQDILSGGIPPGSRLLEGKLAKEFKVSRTPVREALHVLEMEGFLESYPRVGYRVRQIAWDEAVEIYEIRSLLEPLAASKAIENNNQSYIELLEQAIMKSDAACRDDRLDVFFHYDELFDEIIIRASGMKTLFGLWATLRQRLKLYRMQVQSSVGIRLKAVKGHRRIVKCLKSGDAAAVRSAIQAHLDDFKQDIKEVNPDWVRSEGFRQ